MSLRLLLEELSAGCIPLLPDAACRGRHGLFDAAGSDEPVDDVNYRLGAALRICQTQCGSLAECSRWLDGLSKDDQPGGVVAGKIVRSGLKGRRAEQFA